MRVLRSEDRRRTDARGVLQPQLQRIHADLGRQHVDHALHGEGRDRRTGCAICRRLRSVANHVVANRTLCRNVIRRERTQAAVHHRRTGEGASLEPEDSVRGDQRAVFLDADLHPHRRAGCRAGGLEHFVAAHHQAHRQAGLLREQRGNRFEIGHGLAAEAAADLRGIDAQVADLHAEDLRGEGAHLEVALAGGPDLGLAIGITTRDACMRFDVRLMHGRGLELLLDHHIGLGKAGIEVAGHEFEPLRDVGWPGRRGLDPAREHVGEQQRRIGRHRFVHVDDVRQHFVIDLDQRQRLFGDAGADGSHRGDSVAFIQRLLARQDVACDVPEVHRDPLRADVVELLVREILRGDHRLHAGQRLCLGGVERPDHRVCVGRTQNAAIQHAGQPIVRAVQRFAGHLGNAVGTDRSGADPLEALHRVGNDRVVHSYLA